MTIHTALSMSPIPSPPRDKQADRERIESLFVTRQITKAEFVEWLKQGGNHVR